jgi:hypothetical protein
MDRERVLAVLGDRPASAPRNPDRIQLDLSVLMSIRRRIHRRLQLDLYGIFTTDYPSRIMFVLIGSRIKFRSRSGLSGYFYEPT